jgi:hypothetical protein
MKEPQRIKLSPETPICKEPKKYKLPPLDSPEWNISGQDNDDTYIKLDLKNTDEDNSKND